VRWLARFRRQFHCWIAISGDVAFALTSIELHPFAVRLLSPVYRTTANAGNLDEVCHVLAVVTREKEVIIYEQKGVALGMCSNVHHAAGIWYYRPDSS
jgi:hypothetical protein